MKYIRQLAIVVGLLSASSVYAFDWFGGRLSIGGGYGRVEPKLPYSYERSDQDGQMWQVHANYFLNDYFSLVASYADLQPTNKTTGLPIRFRPIIGSVRFNLFQHLPVTPYLTAGAGMSINKREVAGGPAVKWDKLAMQGGIGLEFFVNQGTSFGAEALYHNFLAEDSNRPYGLASLVGMVNIYFGEGPATAKAKAEAEQAKAEAQALEERNRAQQAQAEAERAEAERKAQEIQAQAKKAQAELDDIKQMISRKDLSPVNFKTGSAELLVNSHAALDKIAESAKRYPNLKLRVEGHTDNQGDDKYNLQLSQERADAVRDYLVGTAGLPVDQLVTAGFGKTRPIASNDTKEGRAQNRRVEFIFFLK